MWHKQTTRTGELFNGCVTDRVGTRTDLYIRTARINGGILQVPVHVTLSASSAGQAYVLRGTVTFADRYNSILPIFTTS